MFEVYNNGALEFTGNGKQAAEFIGINVRTLYGLIKGRTLYIPNKANCEQINYRGVAYMKKEVNEYSRHKRLIDCKVGYTLMVDGYMYIVTHIDQRESDVIYTINDDFKLRALEPYTNYNTLYIALRRRLKNVVKKNIQPK